LAHEVKDNSLYNFSHGNTKSGKYVGFADHMLKKNYSAAKESLRDLLPAMEKATKVKFTVLQSEFENLSGDALAQALMTFNNVFARTTTISPIDEGKYALRKRNGDSYVSTSLADVVTRRGDEIMK
jgi:hypothetical protein